MTCNNPKFDVTIKFAQNSAIDSSFVSKAHDPFEASNFKRGAG